MRHARKGTRRALRIRRLTNRLAQHLARKAEIHRTLWRGRRQLQRAIDHVGDLVAALHLIVPLHHLAQHAGLVVHLLRPVDVDIARAGRATLGERRAAGRQQHRHPVAARVDQGVDRIGGTNIGVQHDRLRLPGDHRVAMRHGERAILMRHHHRSRHLSVGPRRTCEGFDDRCEVGARIAEQVIDAVRGERIQIIFCRDARLRFAGHIHCSCSRREVAGTIAVTPFRCSSTRQYWPSPRL